MGITLHENHRALQRLRRCDQGQMTVELAVLFPVVLVVAVVATNALLLFSECAAFDRLAHEAVRVYATAPAYGQSQGQCCALVQQQLDASFDRQNLAVSVDCSGEGLGYVRYTATLEFSPTLFGLGLKSEVFGIPLPVARHSVSYVVDPYKPGVIV